MKTNPSCSAVPAYGEDAAFVALPHRETLGSLFVGVLYIRSSNQVR